MTLSTSRFISTTVVLLIAAAVPVGPDAMAAGRVYRLTEEATYQQGCFDPCDCPPGPILPIQGTLNISFIAIGDVFNFYEVRDVNWTVLGEDGPIRITGSGTYAVGGPGVDLRWMELDLVVGDEPVTVFFSDTAQGPNNLAHIDITISINGIYCEDTVIQVKADPVPPDELVRYRLRDETTFQEGCWDPCDCPLGPLQSVVGGFTLVQLSDNPLFAEYAVVNFHLWARPEHKVVEGRAISGFGMYTTGGEVAPMHRLGLDLVVAGDPRTHFDSDMVIGGGEFPTIEILVSINGMFCWDRVLDLVADPVE